MCSINGLINLNSNLDLADSTIDRMKNIMYKAADRGRDAFGFIAINKNQEVYQEKYLESSTTCIHKINIPKNTKILLSNNRAEPSTEYIYDKKISDIQPYKYGNIWAVHNGTIANDKAIKDHAGIKFGTEIDSMVIPFILNQYGEFSLEGIKYALTKELIGSFSLAAFNTKTNQLLLAVNYKPLFLLFDRETNILYFSSLEDYLEKFSYSNIYGNLNIMEIKPYTALIIDGKTGQIEHTSLYDDAIKTKKQALVCASSGMDSTVAATWAINQGYEVTLLHFNYHCRAEIKELASIQKIADNLNCKLVTIETDFIKNIIGNSRLLGDDPINKEENGIAGAELAHEWVPARNLIFLSIAAAYAEGHGIEYIILGGNLEESGAYADNELIFQKKFNDILPNSLNLGHHVQVLTPIANLMKHEIVKLGIDLNAPLNLTWSCYENGDLHCGQCGPCYMRKTAFKMNNIPEVIQYLND